MTLQVHVFGDNAAGYCATQLVNRLCQTFCLIDHIVKLVNICTYFRNVVNANEVIQISGGLLGTCPSTSFQGHERVGQNLIAPFGQHRFMVTFRFMSWSASLRAMLGEETTFGSCSTTAQKRKRVVHFHGNFNLNGSFCSTCKGPQGSFVVQSRRPATLLCTERGPGRPVPRGQTNCEDTTAHYGAA